MDEMLHAMGSNGFQESLRALEVARHVQVEVAPAAHEAGHGCKVEHDINIGNDGRQVVCAEIDLMKAEVRGLTQSREIRLLQLPRIVRNEGIDSHHAMSLPQQVAAEMRTDETGGTGNDTLRHGTILSDARPGTGPPVRPEALALAGASVTRPEDPAGDLEAIPGRRKACISAEMQKRLHDLFLGRPVTDRPFHVFT
jgi:hypothetical protein